jgi:hypothetical protein
MYINSKFNRFVQVRYKKNDLLFCGTERCGGHCYDFANILAKNILATLIRKAAICANKILRTLLFKKMATISDEKWPKSSKICGDHNIDPNSERPGQPLERVTSESGLENAAGMVAGQQIPLHLLDLQLQLGALQRQLFHLQLELRALHPVANFMNRFRPKFDFKM